MVDDTAVSQLTATFAFGLAFPSCTMLYFSALELSKVPFAMIMPWCMMWTAFIAYYVRDSAVSDNVAGAALGGIIGIAAAIGCNFIMFKFAIHRFRCMLKNKFRAFAMVNISSHVSIMVVMSFLVMMAVIITKQEMSWMEDGRKR